ncbi:MAG: hypothetical protein IKS84_04800, partial [Lachnospiraceae bacterium]|nr:hypothetical protein [Lachnospiraceae bacterium]
MSKKHCRRLKRMLAMLLVLCMMAGMTLTVYADPGEINLDDPAGIEFVDSLDGVSEDEILPEAADAVGTKQSDNADAVSLDGDGTEPAEMADNYTLDGVIYYKVDTDQFKKNPVDFYKALLTGSMINAKKDNVIDYDYEYRRKNQNIRLLWTKLAGAILRRKVGSSYDSQYLEDCIIDELAG